jgi:hypothetical protein
MVPGADDQPMFVSDCHHCGRRELRGPRSLRHDDATGWWTECRACGGHVHVAGAPGDTSAPQAA